MRWGRLARLCALCLPACRLCLWSRAYFNWLMGLNPTIKSSRRW
jgi:hypothetical protein